MFILKLMDSLGIRLKGLTGSLSRYPLTAAFLVAASVTISVNIARNENESKLIMAFIIGAVLSAALQSLYERFFKKPLARVALYTAGVILTAAYYLLILSSGAEMVIATRTVVIFFSLFMAFIWLPVIRSDITFNQSFMSVFKAFFHSLLYSAVIAGGCALITAAVDRLIYNVDPDMYAYIMNFVFVLFAPLFFLSLLPEYPVKDLDAFEKKAACPYFLEVLLSYIIIPLTAVFTAILLIYIALNVGGRFWTRNLIEPMLIAYSIIVILVYILSSRLENRFAGFFRKVFPKILIPIVVFQLVASSLKAAEEGITHGRYFVLIYGLFAVLSGIVMSFFPVRKNGIIAALFIALSAVSAIPPVDAFTVSRISQAGALQSVLEENDMLKNGRIVPSSALSQEDKGKIISAARYLYTMGYTEKIEWLPAGFNYYNDFYDTFGFSEFPNPGKYINLMLDSGLPLEIAGYQYFFEAEVSSYNPGRGRIAQFKISESEKDYNLAEKVIDDKDYIVLYAGSAELVKFEIGQIYTRFKGYNDYKATLTREEAEFFAESEGAKLMVVVRSASIDDFGEKAEYSFGLYILASLK